MKLFTETNFNDIQVLTESSSTNPAQKNYYIEGIFLQAEIKNRNGRVYPMEILENEVKRYAASHILEKCAWGELNHPEGPTINLDRVSHRTVALTKEGTDFVGKAQLVTKNKPGEIAMNLIESGGKLGVSSRALGSLRNIEGVNYVQDDLYLVTPADIVADPSAPNAFVHGIMENREWVWNNGLIVESVVAQLHQQVADTFKPNKKSEAVYEARCRAFAVFMEKISK
jgi:Kyanoviridae head maturation protease